MSQCHVQIVSEETGLNSVFQQPQLPQETLGSFCSWPDEQLNIQIPADMVTAALQVPLRPLNLSSMPNTRRLKTIRTLRLLTLPGARSPSIKGIKGNI